MKKLNSAAIVWSLKNGELPENNDDFYVKPWIP